MADWLAEQIALALVLATTWLLLGVLLGAGIRVWVWARRPLTREETTWPKAPIER